MQTAAQNLVDILDQNQVKKVFCVPGESYLSVLDALYEKRACMDTITCRHEASAANMAEAYGKLTGQPGVCFVTRGPGACHSAIALHTACQDSTPMVLFIGQVSRSDKDREAFQEMDYKQFFSSTAKWVAEINCPQRMTEYVSRALHIAQNGRPGPVIIVLPEDMLKQKIQYQPIIPIHKIEISPDTSIMKKISIKLNESSRPLIILGGSRWNQESIARIESFAEKNHLPVLTAFRFKDLMNNQHKNYVGELGFGTNPELIKAIKKSDLLLTIGARLGDVTTQGYSLLEAEETQRKLVHVHVNAEEINSVYPAFLGIQSSPQKFLEVISQTKWKSKNTDWLLALRKSYEEWIKPVSVKEGVNLSEIFQFLNRDLDHTAIITNGAGNYAAWLHRFYEHKAFKTQLAPTSGAMGYGLPAAIAAKLIYPSREVINVAGDGCFMMSVTELATIAHYNLKLVILLANNNSFGTIRMHQEREYPHRVFGTDLKNPDFMDLAKAYGFSGFRVKKTEAFPEIFNQARENKGCSLIELVQSVEQVSPSTTISKLRACS